MRRFLISASVVVLVGWVLSPSAFAVFQGGHEFFTNIAGTGSHSDNADARGGSGWYDYSTSGDKGSTPYRATSGGYMTYSETWSTPQTVGTVLLAAPGEENRSASGNIYAKTSAGGGFGSTPIATFSNAAAGVSLIDLNASGLYGLKIEVTGGSDPSYYQMGSVGFYAERFSSLAFGQTNISSHGGTGNITDQIIKGDNSSTRWGGSTDSENWGGFTFGGQAKNLVGLLVDTEPFPTYAWTNFDVQVYRLGAWQTLGRASAPNDGTDLYWVDFGTTVTGVEQVRLYGSTAGGNNPGSATYITDILAFGPVPEPASFSLLALGGLTLLRRRK